MNATRAPDHGRLNQSPPFRVELLGVPPDGPRGQQVVPVVAEAQPEISVSVFPVILKLVGGEDRIFPAIAGGAFVLLETAGEP